MPWRYRLAQRIVLSVVLGLAVILAIFGGLAVWTERQSTAAEYAARLQMSQSLAAETDVVVQGAEDSLRRAASRLVGWSGSTLSADQQASLRLLVGPDGAFSTVEVLNGAGARRWSSSADPAVTPPSWAGLPIVARARAGAGAAAGECPDDSVPGRPSLCLAMPLAGALFSGALVAEIDARDGTLPLLPPAGTQPVADLQVLDATGRVVVSTTSAQDGTLSEHAAVLRPLLGGTRAGVVLHRQGPGDAFPSHLVTYVPLPRVAGWGLVAEIPQEQVLAAPRLLATRLAVFGLLAVLLAGAVAWADVHRVIRPLRVLTEAAGRFASGDLDHPIRLQRRDELGLLARTFETMRQRLQTSLAEIEQGRRVLEQRVAERTAEVAEQNRRLATLNAEAAHLNMALEQRTAERAALLSRVLSAQEGERERIARDLHDSTGQSLAAVLLSLELLDEQLAPEPTALRASLTRSRNLATATLTELRVLIAGLRPALLDDLGLVSALRAFASQRLEEHGVTVGFTVNLPQRLPPTVEIALFRIVQEAITNIAKYAHAQQVTVTLDVSAGLVQTVVTDDGVGFDAQQVRADAVHGLHVGLLGMRERAELLGGQVQIMSRSGEGTTIVVTVPVVATGVLV